MKSFKLKKLKLLSLVISVIAVLLLTVMSVSAQEFTYSGTGSVSGGGDIAGKASYSLKVTNGSAPIIAYRFSVYKSDGTVPAGGWRVDIYNNSWIKYDGYTSYDSMNVARHQKSKQNWQSEGEFNNNYSATGWGFHTVSSANVGDGGMPQDPTKMEDWLMTKDSKGKYPNALAVFELCNLKENQIKNDYYLIIEPVIQCQVDSKISALTNTELAVCGGMELGYDYEGHGGTTGTFKFISLRVCHFFAQYMRINGSPNLWENAPDLGKPVYNKDGTLDRFSTKATTFYNVIHKAYSVNLVEAKDVVKQVTVNIYPNGSVYTYGGKTYDKTKCTFTVPAGSQISLPEAKRIYWHNPEWRIYKQGSNNMADYKSAKAGGTITVNENIDIVPYYSEKKVRYNVNGGKTEESATWRSGSDGLIMKNNGVFETKPVVSMMTDYRDSSGYWQWIENKDTTPFKLSSSSNIFGNVADRDVVYASNLFGLYRPGYRFAGWSIRKDNSYIFDDGRINLRRTYKENEAASWTDMCPSEKDDPQTLTFYAQWAPINITYDLNLNNAGAVPPLTKFPVNHFSFTDNNRNGITTTYSQKDSSVTLNGTFTQKSAYFGGHSYADNILTEGEKMYITLVYRGGSANKNGWLIVDQLSEIGGCPDGVRNWEVAVLPTESSPITSVTLDGTKGATSLRYGLWTENEATKYSNYKCSIYITKEKPVTDPSLTNSGLGNIESVKDGRKFANLPGAVSYAALNGTNSNPAVYKIPDVGRPHPSYVLNTGDGKTGWTEKPNGSGPIYYTTKIVNANEKNSTNKTIYADWRLDELYIRYNTGADDAVVSGKLDNKAVTKEKKTNIILVGGERLDPYNGTYHNPNSDIAIRKPKEFELKRPGYKFTGWKFTLTNKIYNPGDKEMKIKGSDLFGDQVASGLPGEFVAQWTPIQYQVEYWADLGDNNRFEPFYKNEYQKVEKQPWGGSASGYFPYAGNTFLRACGAGDIQTMTYDKAEYLNANKYSFTGHRFNGWFASKLKRNTEGNIETDPIGNPIRQYCVDDAGGAKWVDELTIMTHPSDYQLHIFDSRSKINKLTTTENDVIRMYLVPDYKNFKNPPVTPTPGDPTISYPWEPVEYFVHYCGHSADDLKDLDNEEDYEYLEGTVLGDHYGCQGTSNIELTLYDAETWRFNFDAYAAAYKDGFQKEPSAYPHKTEVDRMLRPSIFGKVGFHQEPTTFWYATTDSFDNRTTYVYGKNKLTGQFGWAEEGKFTKEEFEIRYFDEMEKGLVSLIAVDGAEIYMHAQWSPNLYKIYYCGNGADEYDSNIYANLSDGSTFTHTSVNGLYCPDAVNGECPSGYYKHEKNWSYTDDPSPLLENGFSRFGYNFDGWRLYNPATNEWYGEMKTPRNQIGWTKASNILSYKTFADKEEVYALSQTHNAIFYAVAQWAPWEYYIDYHANNITPDRPIENIWEKGPVYLADYSFGGMDSCYFGYDYWLTTPYELGFDFPVTNAEPRESRDLIYRFQNEAGLWYGRKGDVLDWYNKTDFDSGAAVYAEFVSFSPILYNYENATVFNSLASKDKEVINAYAQWRDYTNIRYISEGQGSKVSAPSKILGGYICNTNGTRYSDAYISDDRPGTLTDKVFATILQHNNDNWQLSREGYTFTNWSFDRDGKKVVNENSVFSLKQLREALALPLIGTVDVPLFAQWKANTYHINYCGNGADGQLYGEYNGAPGSEFRQDDGCNNAACGIGNYYDARPWVYDESQTLTPNMFTRSGYTFAGWALTPNPDYGDIIYKDSQEVRNLASEEGSEVFLYAQWVPETFRYNANGGTVGLDYRLNSKGDICNSSSEIIKTKLSDKEITIVPDSNFKLSNDGFFFAGWSKDKSTENLLVPGKYTQSEILEYFGNDDKVLYALWVNKLLHVQYSPNKKVEFRSSAFTQMTNAPWTFQNFNGSNYHQTVIYPNDYNAGAAVHFKNLFSFRVDGEYNVFDGWIAKRTGTDYSENGNFTEYFGIDKKWHPESELASVPAYLFKEGEMISPSSSGVSFNDICPVDVRDPKTDFYVTLFAQWSSGASSHTLKVQYRIQGDDAKYIQWGDNFTMNKDQIIYTKAPNEPYEQTISVKVMGSGDNATLTFSGDVLTPNIPKDIDAFYPGFKFSNWTKSGTDFAPYVSFNPELLLTPADKKALVNGDHTIVLDAEWSPNTLTIHYNTADGSVISETYTVDKDNNIIKKDDNSKYKITRTFESESRNVTILHPDLGPNSSIERPGYHFDGEWKNGITGDLYAEKSIQDIVEMTDGAILHDNTEVTLYANWVPNTVDILYNTNFGNVKASNKYYANGDGAEIIYDRSSNSEYKQKVNYNDNAKVHFAKDFSLVRDGYEFTGWLLTIDNDVVMENGKPVVFEEGNDVRIFNYIKDITVKNQRVVLYAQWEPTAFEVYYCGNGADDATYDKSLMSPPIGTFNGPSCNNAACGVNFYDNTKHQFNKPFMAASNGFVKTGYRFAGYWTDINGKVFNDSQSYDEIPAANDEGVRFLYAQWLPIEYTVKYDGNEATSGNVPSQRFVYKQTQKLQPNVFVKDYCKPTPDKTWYATREVGDVIYYCTDYNNGNPVWKPETEVSSLDNVYYFSDEQPVTNLTNIDDDIITMHASWTPNKLTVLYNSNKGVISSDTYSLNSNDYVMTKADNSQFKQVYVYNENDTTVTLYQHSVFGLYYQAENKDEVTKFIGWSQGSKETIPDYTSSNLVASIFSLAPNLKYEDATVTLYAIWKTNPPQELVYIEGEEVTYDKLVNDIYDVIGHKDITHENIVVFDRNEAVITDTAPEKLPPVNGSGKYQQTINEIKANNLYTFYMHVRKGMKVTGAHSFTVWALNKPSVVNIDIVYNNPPTVTALDRWFTLEEALAGKITEEELLKTATAEDVEDGNLTKEVKLLNFEPAKYNKIGEWTVEYEVTDKIPTPGQHKTSKTTAKIHIVDTYGDARPRFISDSYYPLMNNENAKSASSVHVDKNGNFLAKKVDGVLYYLDANGEVALNAAGDGYAVDACLKVKKFVNADGTYTLVPLSKWYKDDDYKDVLKEALSNTKDENGTWARYEESWTFTANEVKAIKQNLLVNDYDPSFYTNHAANGRRAAGTIAPKLVNTTLCLPATLPQIFANYYDTLSFPKFGFAK